MKNKLKKHIKILTKHDFKNNEIDKIIYAYETGCGFNDCTSGIDNATCPSGTYDLCDIDNDACSGQYTKDICEEDNYSGGKCQQAGKYDSCTIDNYCGQTDGAGCPMDDY